MNWIFIVPIGIIITLFVALLVGLYIYKDKGVEEIPKSLIHLVNFFVGLMKFLNHALFVSVFILIVTLIIIGFLTWSITPQYLYVYSVGFSITFAYFPLIVKYSIRWFLLANNTAYTRDLVEKYNKTFERLNFRMITYAMLLILYIIRNYNSYRSYHYDSVFIKSLIEISAEALLTFVIVDTIITIYKEKRTPKN
ncbi:hypothetical protein P4I98_03375 [Bacillus cereus]|nr:hypothetical protein [Bacillus cereus]